MVRSEEGRKDSWGLDVRFGMLGGALSSHRMLLTVGGFRMMKIVRARCLFGLFSRGERVGWCIRPYPR